MKTYFRLLSFAKPIEKFAIPYILFTILSVIFNTLNLAIAGAIVKTLFDREGVAQAITKPDNWDKCFGLL